MIKEFSSSIEDLENTKECLQTKTRHENLFKIISDFDFDSVLDVGDFNPFTQLLIDRFEWDIIIDNASGDLDIEFIIPKRFAKYDLIVCSHIIEHLFNPFFLLSKLKYVIEDNGTLIIALPQRPKFLWSKGHFHEIDDYRLRLLLKRAGFKVERKIKEKVKRDFWTYFTGLRPFLRLFLEYNSIYICEHNKKEQL